MRRVYPRMIRDVRLLSRMLEELLQALQESPLRVELRALSFETGIPEQIFRYMQQVHRHPVLQGEVRAEDFHIVFSNILFRYPAVRVYCNEAGALHFVL